MTRLLTVKPVTSGADLATGRRPLADDHRRLSARRGTDAGRRDRVRSRCRRRRPRRAREPAASVDRAAPGPPAPPGRRGEESGRRARGIVQHVFDHVGIRVADRAESVRFYDTVLARSASTTCSSAPRVGRLLDRAPTRQPVRAPAHRLLRAHPRAVDAFQRRRRGRLPRRRRARARPSTAGLLRRVPARPRRQQRRGGAPRRTAYPAHRSTTCGCGRATRRGGGVL